MVDAQVLVVGGGPVGETLLALLGAHGISAIGFEREREIWPKPRAVHFDGETLRAFQALGIGDAVLAVTEPMRDYRMENEAGTVLVTYPTGEFGDQGWVDDVMFHQPDVDGLLRSVLERYPDVELLTGQTVESVEQTDDGVSLVAISDSGARTFTGRYLIGADGASSTVRRAIGGRYEELGPNDPWLVVDGLFRESPAEQGSMVFFAHPSRPHLWGALPGMRRRMEFKVLPDDDREVMGTPEWVAEATRGLMRPDNFDIERTAIYTFRSCMVPEWRSGRVLLAGDSAHLAPPLFGQGLCSGIRDATNLAWKLALVLRGADDTLLDTYQSERKPHVLSWIEQATRMSGFVQTTDPVVAVQRDEYLLSHPGEGAAVVPALGPGLDTDAPRAGLLAIQPSVPGPGRFDDGVGMRFLVAATPSMLAGLPGSLRDELAAAADLVAVLDSTAPGVAELLVSTGTDAVVVRPDRYILDTPATPEGLASAIETVLGLRVSASARAAGT